MLLNCLIPLCLALSAVWVNRQTNAKTLDGIPSAISIIVALISLIWFTLAAPMFMSFGLVVLVYFSTKILLPKQWTWKRR